MLVEEYFEKFSNTMCCFDDLRNYLEVLSEEERVGLGGRLGGVAKEFEGMVRCSCLLVGKGVADCLLEGRLYRGFIGSLMRLRSLGLFLLLVMKRESNWLLVGL